MVGGKCRLEWHHRRRLRRPFAEPNSPIFPARSSTGRIAATPRGATWIVRGERRRIDRPTTIESRPRRDAARLRSFEPKIARGRSETRRLGCATVRLLGDVSRLRLCVLTRLFFARGTGRFFRASRPCAEGFYRAKSGQFARRGESGDDPALRAHVGLLTVAQSSFFLASNDLQTTSFLAASEDSKKKRW